jgi:GNAT superfamily N-acetyltransferase
VVANVAGVEFRVEVTAYDAPEVSALIAELQEQYVHMYGSHDHDPTSADAFVPPRGLFLLGWLDAVPVAMGGFRTRDDGAAEIKRMYVAPAARGLGLARRMLAELERAAGAAGFARMVLNTGWRQEAAIALYLSSGYRPIEAFGHYAHLPTARFYGKELNQNGPSEEDEPFAVRKVSD